MMPTTADPFDLARFVKAQDPVFTTVLAELRAGRKRTHWIWFIFPQVFGLGHSSTSRHYAIGGIKEARAYLQHLVLGPRLVQCAETLLAVEGRTAYEIMPYPDDLKLRSSMTLFERAAEPDSVFSQVLLKYFQGRPDELTLGRLGAG